MDYSLEAHSHGWAPWRPQDSRQPARRPGEYARHPDEGLDDRQRYRFNGLLGRRPSGDRVLISEVELVM
ncbi:MAG: hypothetical protein FJZ00_11870 [Candidatus Sericytochromatia bacterium]|uniref:Uncharacterized protein n=1 Tax=Candidatus Tanganyikabacteria bacterium TaxID=2961651 RepID=A0A937X4P3_9BACT|nr:hypothetical protein [Candidatus Tanganyikabacteria bacterium]